ncbi:MAG: alpha/beta hydrolase [Thermoguttaceae bacterium]|nr:alpha/beta hydrolase [Thermoguttaceae bacterium]
MERTGRHGGRAGVPGPRPVGKPIFTPAWQDAQRAVRILRSRAKEWGLDPEKIGVQGYSAGGHLTLLTACNSQTLAYEPIDELDEIPCHVNFAMPVYPAYVLEDGAEGPNTAKGNEADFAPGLNFDAKTPPMCLLHGDKDIYSPMGSVKVYAELRKHNIPCELHIFADAVHGFMFWNDAENTKTWRSRGLEWMKVMGYF